MKTEEKKYMIVVHYHKTDTITNMYFKTRREMNDVIKIVEESKDNEILHKLKIKEVE